MSTETKREAPWWTWLVTGVLTAAVQGVANPHLGWGPRYWISLVLMLAMVAGAYIFGRHVERQVTQ